MTTKLAKFQSISQHSVDPVLAEQWEYDVRHHGEKNIKLQIAQAKRTATALAKSVHRFCNLSPEQELAIKALFSAMTSRASELAKMVAWAHDYKTFCDVERRREDADELEAIVAIRWRNDDAALQFEADLIEELSTFDGKLAFAQWLHSIGERKDVALENISTCINRLAAGNTLRERVAVTIKQDRVDSDNEWTSRQGLNVICGWRTYERYLAHRKDVAAKTRGILKGFSPELRN